MPSLPRDRSCRRILVSVAVLTLALALHAPDVFAHAKLVRSEPAAGATLKQAPKTVVLWFSEELEGAMCAVAVTDQNGRQVGTHNITVTEGNKKLQVELEDLGSGTYTVDWNALSTDQHTMKGKFTFTVALAANPAAAPTGGQPSSQGAQDGGRMTPSPSQSSASPTETTQESGSSWTQSLVRWLQYLAMMMLFGGFAFHSFVLSPALRRTHGINDAQEAVAAGAGGRRIMVFSWLSLALLIVVSVIGLILQAATVFNKSIGEVLSSPGLLNQIITRTGFGASWRLQVWAIAALLIVVFYLSQRLKREPEGEHRLLWWSGLAMSAVLLLAPTWTGHAVVAAKEFPFAVGTDWLHLLAVGFWVGGLFHLALTMPQSISGLKDSQRLRVVHRVIPLFTRLAVASTILIVLTGLYNSWLHVDRFGELWSTTYGETLLLKVLLVIPMLVLGGINTFIIHPRATRLVNSEGSEEKSEPKKLIRDFYRSVKVEAALGGLVLLVAAILVFLQPAREHPMSSAVRPNQASTTQAPP